VATAGLLELGTIELRVGEAELGDRPQFSQLPTPESDSSPRWGIHRSMSSEGLML